MSSEFLNHTYHILFCDSREKSVRKERGENVVNIYDRLETRNLIARNE